MTDKPHPLLTADLISDMQEVPRAHQFNDNAIRHTRSLTDRLGLEKLGVHLVRVEPGQDSTQHHTHSDDEEFVYILSGEGLARIGDVEHQVAAGDFMGFAAGSLPHSMHNAGHEDLVYLMGGTRSEIDICDYPDIERRMYRVRGKKHYVSTHDLHDLPGKPR